MKRIYYEYKPEEGATVAVYSPDSTELELPCLIALKITPTSPVNWTVVSEYASNADVIRQAILLFDSLCNTEGEGA